MRCKQHDCTRRAHTSGWCTTHYRRLRSGQPRAYVHYDEDANGSCKPVSAKTARTKREKPFAAEYALLAELGLARN